MLITRTFRLVDIHIQTVQMLLIPFRSLTMSHLLAVTGELLHQASGGGVIDLLHTAWPQGSNWRPISMWGNGRCSGGW